MKNKLGQISKGHEEAPKEFTCSSVGAGTQLQPFGRGVTNLICNAESTCLLPPY